MKNNEINNISPRDFHAQKDTLEKYFLLDVREYFEHREFNIGGSCIPLGDIISKIKAIPVDRPVLVYCKKGVRSQIAIQRLQDRFGMDNLYNLAGGIEGWKLSKPR